MKDTNGRELSNGDIVYLAGESGDCAFFVVFDMRLSDFRYLSDLDRKHKGVNKDSRELLDTHYEIVGDILKTSAFKSYVLSKNMKDFGRSIGEAMKSDLNKFNSALKRRFKS